MHTFAAYHFDTTVMKTAKTSYKTEYRASSICADGSISAFCRRLYC